MTGNACVLSCWVKIVNVVGKVGAVGMVVVGDTISRAGKIGKIELECKSGAAPSLKHVFMLTVFSSVRDMP